MGSFQTVHLDTAQEMLDFNPLLLADIYASTDEERLERWAFKYPELFNTEDEQTPRKGIGYHALCVSARVALRARLNDSRRYQVSQISSKRMAKLLESGYLLLLSVALDRRWWLPRLTFHRGEKILSRLQEQLVGRTAAPLLPVSHLESQWLALDLQFTSPDGEPQRGGIGETIQEVERLCLIDHRLIKKVPK